MEAILNKDRGIRSAIFEHGFGDVDVVVVFLFVDPIVDQVIGGSGFVPTLPPEW